MGDGLRILNILFNLYARNLSMIFWFLQHQSLPYFSVCIDVFAYTCRLLKEGRMSESHSQYIHGCATMKETQYHSCKYIIMSLWHFQVICGMQVWFVVRVHACMVCGLRISYFLFLFCNMTRIHNLVFATMIAFHLCYGFLLWLSNL